MFKFGITLCVVFIFLNTADAKSKVLEDAKQRYDNEILDWINDTAQSYERAQSTAAKILQSILNKLRDYRLAKPAEILAASQKKQDEADVLIDAAINVDAIDCLDPISDLNVTAKNVTNTVKACISTQLGMVDSNIVRLNSTMSKLFNELEHFQSRADKCHSDNVNAKNLVIIKCLKPIRRQLKRLKTLDSASLIRYYTNWLNNFDSTMEACTGKSLEIFNGQSRVLIDTVRDCIEIQTSSTKDPIPAESDKKVESNKNSTSK